MGRIAERRADLDLQISLLAEHEITQSLQLLCLIAERLGIKEGASAEISELKRHVAPEKVLDHIERETRVAPGRVKRALCEGIAQRSRRSQRGNWRGHEKALGEQGGSWAGKARRAKHRKEVTEGESVS
jgi:hypothetical protein